MGLKRSGIIMALPIQERAAQRAVTWIAGVTVHHLELLHAAIQ